MSTTRDDATFAILESEASTASGSSPHGQRVPYCTHGATTGRTRAARDGMPGSAAGRVTVGHGGIRYRRGPGSSRRPHESGPFAIASCTRESIAVGPPSAGALDRPACARDTHPTVWETRTIVARSITDLMARRLLSMVARRRTSLPGVPVGGGHELTDYGVRRLRHRLVVRHSRRMPRAMTGQWRDIPRSSPRGSRNFSRTNPEKFPVSATYADSTALARDAARPRSRSTRKVESVVRHVRDGGGGVR